MGELILEFFLERKFFSKKICEGVTISKVVELSPFIELSAEIIV